MNIKEHKISSPDFLPELLGSFAKPAAENPTVAIMELQTAKTHKGITLMGVCAVTEE